MPPPNQLVPSLKAKCRTFMCTMGTCGLLGCRTRLTPAAQKRSAWVFIWAFKPGEASPSTSLKFTPPRSHTFPEVSTRVRPPPPPGRVQASSTKAAPPCWASTFSTPATMSSCKARNSSARAFSRSRFMGVCSGPRPKGTPRGTNVGTCPAQESNCLPRCRTCGARMAESGQTNRAATIANRRNASRPRTH